VRMRPLFSTFMTVLKPWLCRPPSWLNIEHAR
jgi:hypothetical protein